MGREVKRVATDFEWPLDKVWEGYLNPWYKHRMKCFSCDGSGYSPMADHFKDQWYGNAAFDPVEYGSELMTPQTEAVRRFVEHQVDRSMKAAAEGVQQRYDKVQKEFFYDGTHCYYTNNGKLSREEAIQKEIARLIEMWNEQWSHHLIQADVEVLVAKERLWDFVRRPLPGISIEQYTRTHAYYLWIEAGRPEGRSDEFWLKSEKLHNHFWLPYNNGYMPTAQEVNAWSIGGFGHDGSNCHYCVEARCQREGCEVLCDECKGDGGIWTPPDAEQKAEEWEPTEPPAGEAYQIWETVSEGSPISPAFKDPQILAEWMSNAKTWGASKKMTTEQWLSWITGPGWAPSGMMQGGVYVDGVEGTVNALEKSAVSD